MHHLIALLSANRSCWQRSSARVRKRRCIIANTSAITWAISRWVRKSVASSLHQSVMWNAMQVAVGNGYDETPMALRDSAAALLARSENAPAPNETALQPSSRVALMMPKPQGKSKLLQIRHAWSFLVSRTVGDDADAEYLMIIGRTPGRICKIARNTPEAELEALCTDSPVSLTEVSMAQCTRLNRIDARLSNLVVERRLKRRTQRMIKTIESVIILCRQHKMGRLRRKSLRGFEKAHSGV